MLRFRLPWIAAGLLAFAIAAQSASPSTAARPSTSGRMLTPMPFSGSFVRRPLVPAGTVASVTMANRSTRMLSLSPAQVTAMRTGRSMLVETGFGTVDLVPSSQTVRGIPTAVLGTTLALRTTNGSMQGFRLTPQAVRALLLAQGSMVSLSTSSAFTTPLRPAEITLTPGIGASTMGTPRLGTIAGLNGRLVTLMTLDRHGMQTFEARPVNTIHVRAGERVAAFTQGHTITRLVPALQSVVGQIVAVGNSSVTLRLMDGATEVINVSPAAERSLLSMLSRQVTVSTSDAFMTSVDLPNFRFRQ